MDREIARVGSWRAVRERFTEAGPAKTLWKASENGFSGVLMRLVGLLRSGAFRKQSRAHMLDFKAFSERGADVRDTA